MSSGICTLPTTQRLHHGIEQHRWRYRLDEHTLERCFLRLFHHFFSAIGGHHASSTGSTEVNQKLSEDRANNVTNILLQKGNVPLTRILAPGAMGESRQVNNDKSVEGQSENRRVVVRVLQNKAIAGI